MSDGHAIDGDAAEVLPPMLAALRAWQHSPDDGNSQAVEEAAQGAGPLALVHIGEHHQPTAHRKICDTVAHRPEGGDIGPVAAKIVDQTDKMPIGGISRRNEVGVAEVGPGRGKDQPEQGGPRQGEIQVAQTGAHRPFARVRRRGEPL